MSLFKRRAAAGAAEKEPDLIHVEAMVPLELYERLEAQLEKSGGNFPDWLRLKIRQSIKGPTVYHLDDEILFGKFRGEKIRTLIENEPDYIVWCSLNVETFNLAQDAAEHLERLQEETWDYDQTGALGQD